MHPAERQTYPPPPRKWEAVEVGGGYYKLVNRTNGMVADSWGATSDGSAARQVAWNVLLTSDDPRVLDFGIAHAADGTSVTRIGVLTGTPGWISPEHYRSGVTAAEGDMFAWGALVAYAATGRLPFGTGAPEAVAYRVMSGRPDLDGTPEALKELLERTLAKEPAERPTAADAVDRCVHLLAAECTQVFDGPGTAEADNNPTFLADLVTAQWSVPTAADPAWPNSPSAPRSSSRRRAVVAVLATAVVIGAGAGGALALHHDDHRAPGASGSAATTDAKDTVGADSATDRTTSAVPGPGVTARAATDPRAIPVPSDPLAGVAAPAFTRADDETQPLDVFGNDDLFGLPGAPVTDEN
ncbi:protein kinase [Streptomyces sp. NPDC101175]|uniref:protein kinase domain-containing protein n=1 Tax=Streptomyces sp. NPDC101175 TaxID=3366123 RepID=UPI003838C636